MRRAAKALKTWPRVSRTSPYPSSISSSMASNLSKAILHTDITSVLFSAASRHKGTNVSSTSMLAKFSAFSETLPSTAAMLGLRGSHSASTELSEYCQGDAAISTPSKSRASLFSLMARLTNSTFMQVGQSVRLSSRILTLLVSSLLSIAWTWLFNFAAATQAARWSRKMEAAFFASSSLFLSSSHFSHKASAGPLVRPRFTP